MKKLLVIFILLLSVFLCGCKKDTEKNGLDTIKNRGNLVVGVKFETKPFGYIDNGELKGYDIDVAKNIAKAIFDDESKVEFIEVTPENRISKLLNGEIDMIIATMTDTQDRRLVVDFSYPYYVSGQTVLCTQNSEVSSIADLKNHNTVVVIGTTAEKTLKRLFIKSNVIRAMTYNEAFASIDKNTCMIADEAILRGFSIDNPNYQLFNKKLSAEPYAVALRKEEDQLKEIVDYTIKHLEKTGKLEEIKKIWIK